MGSLLFWGNIPRSSFALSLCEFTGSSINNNKKRIKNSQSQLRWTYHMRRTLYIIKEFKKQYARGSWAFLKIHAPCSGESYPLPCIQVEFVRAVPPRHWTLSTAMSACIYEVNWPASCPALALQLAISCTFRNHGVWFRVYGYFSRPKI